MVVSLSRLLKSFSEPAFPESNSAPTHDDLPPITYPSSAQSDMDQTKQKQATDSQGKVDQDEDSQREGKQNRRNQRLRAERVSQAVAQVGNNQAPTPLTDRYLKNKKNYRSPNRPPFDPNTLWQLKHGRCPIMTELIDVVDEQTLNAMPIEAVAILDRINNKLRRYRDWSDELSGEQEEWFCERQFVIDKLIAESIPEALRHYEQLLRFSPHRTKNNIVQGNMTAGDILTDLFLEIDYELDELLDELHNTVINRLASTHRYVKSRTQS